MSGTGAEPQWVTIAEASRRLGITERAVLKRISKDQLPAQRHGRKWLVQVGSEPTEPSSRTSSRTSSEPTEPSELGSGTSSGVRNGHNELVAELRHQLEGRDQHITRLEQLNVELAGQVGFLQGRLAGAEEQIKLLESPKEVVEESTSPAVGKSWWRRFVDRAYGRTP